MSSVISGIGMTSQRTRERMLVRLREQGIRDEVTLAAMGSVARHIFVDEALSSRAYEDVALPIGHGSIRSAVFQRPRAHSAKRGHGVAREVGQLDRDVDAIHEHEGAVLQLHAVRHFAQRCGEPRGGGAGEVDGGELGGGQARKERQAEHDGGG